MKAINKTHGFTLMEAMIVVAIIGIIASLALPSYGKYVERSKRSEARTALLDAAARQERNYSDNRQYTSTEGAGGLSIPDPTSCTAAGIQTETCKYTLNATAANVNQTFIITATPEGWVDADCNVLSIDQTGTKTENGASDLAFCWGK